MKKQDIKSEPKTETTDERPRLTRYLNAGSVSVVVFIFFSYFMLPMRNGYMLKWYEEMSLFEPTRFFFSECFNYPGGLLRYAGAWLTQMMYYPASGSVILIALWLAMSWLTCKAFGLKKAGVTLSLIIPLAMLASILQLDEAWLTLKTPGYIYSNTLGYIFAISMVWIYRIARQKRILSLIVPAIISLTYFLAGFYALLSAAVCLVMMTIEMVRNKDYRLIAAIAATILMMVAVPILYYYYWPGNLADNDYLVLKGLPELMFTSFDVYLWMPFVVATVWMIVLGITGSFHFQYASKAATWASIAILAIAMIWTASTDRKSEQLRASVLMMKFIDQHNWQAINNIMLRLKEEPNHTMLVINNLANASQGKPTLKLPEFSPKPADGRHIENFTMSVFVDVPVNYYTGETNKSYRWSMEHSVQYGKRVFFLKYMVKNALVDGDIALAKRCNDVLHRTLFHRAWAEEMDRYIENPSLIDSNEEFQAIRSLKHQE